jgi:hypothetical protein
MTDTQARARVWTLCLAALVRAALTGPLVALLTPLAHASSPTLHVVAAVLAAALVGASVALAAALVGASVALAAALVGASVALAVLLIVAVLRVVRPRLDGQR